MKFTTEIKPTIIEAKTKSELVSKIQSSYSGFFSSSSYGYGMKKRTGGLLGGTVSHIIAYNLEKHRAIKKQSPRASYNGTNGKIRKTKIIKNGFWRAYVYKIPVGILDISNTTVHQNSRNFTFKKKARR